MVLYSAVWLATVTKAKSLSRVDHCPERVLYHRRALLNLYWPADCVDNTFEVTEFVRLEPVFVQLNVPESIALLVLRSTKVHKPSSVSFNTGQELTKRPSKASPRSTCNPSTAASTEQSPTGCSPESAPTTATSTFPVATSITRAVAKDALDHACSSYVLVLVLNTS